MINRETIPHYEPESQPEAQNNKNYPEHWHPLEEKRLPDYTQERFNIINSIYKLDEPGISNLLAEIHDVRLMAPIMTYLNYRLLEIKQKDALPEIEEKLLHSLEAFALDSDCYGSIRYAALSALGGLGEKALPILDKLARDNQNKREIRQVAIIAMGNVGAPALPLLEKLEKENDDFYIAHTIEAVKQSIGESTEPPKSSQVQQIKDIIESQEPALITPLDETTKTLGVEKAKILTDISDIISEIKKDYPEVVGLVILGSLSKGYWVPEKSDLDWAFVFHGTGPIPRERAIEIKARFGSDFTTKIKSRVPSFGLCSGIDHSLDASNISQETPEDNLEVVFNGLFFGDRQQLKEVQRKIVQVVDNEKWEKIRQVWIDSLNGYTDKMQERFKLTQNQVRLIKTLRTILWCPPDLNTAKKIYS